MSKTPAKETGKQKSSKSSSALSSKKSVRKALSEEPSLVPEKYQDLIALGLLGLLLVVFYWPVLFSGKVFFVPDNMASFSTKPFLSDAQQKGIFPLWFPYIFSGMPSYGSLMATGDRSFDFLYQTWRFIVNIPTMITTNPSASWIIIYYFLFGAGLYALLRVKGSTPFQALIGGIGGSFATLSVVWITVGHNTKIVAVAMIPFILMFAERLRQQEGWKKFLLNAGLLSVLMNVEVRSTHVQMIYYAFMAIGIYFLFELISTLVKKEPVQAWLRSVGGFAIAALLGVSMSADTYLSVLDYSPYSIRSSESITQKHPELAPQDAQQQKQPSGGGVSYDYATNWSFGPSEIITFFIPSYYGYGDQTYWGPQPFTHSPNFFGSIILILAIIGLIYYRREHFVQAMFVIGLLSLILSFGKYFPILFDPMFYYMPFFNKFRTPSMILILLEIAACVLAGYGLKAIFEIRRSDDESLLKPFKIAAMGSAGLFAITILTISNYRSSYISGIAKSEIGERVVATYGKEYPNVIEQFGQPIFDMMKTDLFISLFISMLALALIYFFLQRKVAVIAFQGALLVLLVFDLWRADVQLISNARDAKEQSNYFAPTDVVHFLLDKQKTDKFRILPLAQDKQPNWYAYFRIESVGGYHAAKLRLYQDMVEVVGGGSTDQPMFFTSPAMMDLLNIRYLIVDKQASAPGYKEAFAGSAYVLERENWAPRAWLVSKVEQKPAVDILKNIKASSFNPREVAYLESEVPSVQAPDSTTSVKLAESGIHNLDFKVNASGQNFLFLSEIYYPAGWKCLIDGKETEIYKTDYAFRGVVVPKGTHDVKFVFEPSSFALGKSVSLGVNILVTLVLGFAGVEALRRRQGAKPDTKTDKK